MLEYYRMETDVSAKKIFPWERIFILVFLGLAIGLLGYAYSETRGPDRDASPEPFVVAPGMTGREAIEKLEKAGFVRNVWFFEAILRSKNPLGTVTPGGYELSKSMSAFEIASNISGEPTSIWITVPEGLRKEEIAAIMQGALHWNTESVETFVAAYRTQGEEYYEGVYFPETYLIPRTDGGAKVAKRMITTFNEKLATLSPVLAKQNIQWTTALKVASLVEREAASAADMPIISAVIWNRLMKKQRLEIDATVQYAKSQTQKNTTPPPAGGWWVPLVSGDTNLDSPYNTYRNAGLPPTPIANPGLAALRAAVEPSNSKCLYYIHDTNKEIHCAVTFAEHKANIAKYLK